MFRRLFAIGVVLALSVTASGCSGGSADDRADPTTTTTPATTEAPPEPEKFEGSVDDFYVLPDPLPAGKPGELIRVQRLGGTGGQGETGGLVTMRIMYHSNDALDRDRAVTAVVTYPTAKAPSGGWPVISTAHGTTGVASDCALSRTGEPAPGWGVDGVWVMTDYVGQGPVGEIHPYFSKPSEGNSVIDAVRAVRNIPETNASNRWVSIGHSQGGHGALAAHELAAGRAPELDLVGTVSLAPAALFDRVYGGIDPIVTTILTMMAVYSGVSEHPSIDLADYFTPEALAASKVFETGCLDQITEALIPVAMEGPFLKDPRQTEPARSEMLANDVGEVAVDGVPLLLISGTRDDRVVIERARDLFTRLCESGQGTEFHVIADADHGSVLAESADLVANWIDDRLAEVSPTDGCPDQPAPERP